MLVTYLRSSMSGCYEICPHKCFISYCLGLPEEPNKKAELGNVLHKICECLARAKLHYQNTGEAGGFDIGDEYLGKFIVDDIFDNTCIDKLHKLSFEYHRSLSPHEWDNKDFEKTQEWAYKVVSFQEGAFDPRNKVVAHVEKFFDLPIEEDWANYSYNIGGKIIEGNFALKGTVDLIMKVSDDHLEVLDYKSGKRINWATGEEKTYDCLQRDPQLLMYYYACRRIFPDIPYFDFTIYYVNDGGPFTMSFDDSHYEMAKDFIKTRLLELRDCQKPRLISPTREKRERNFKCKYLCTFAKNNYPGTDISICEFFQNKVKETSADEVLAQYGDHSKIGVYGDGGGRKA